MIFRQLFDEISHTYTYLIASAYGREALLIDPVFENVAVYIQLLNELQLKLVMSIDTHTHADHITASGILKKQLSCQIAMGEHTKAQCVSVHLAQGQELFLDGLKLQVLYTPGHTNDCYSFLMGDRVFTGDTLLIRGTGRTDFQNGDPYQLYDSLFNQLLKLPEDTLVYPAHDYKGFTVSTIGEEKRFNPRLQVTSVTEFVELMNHLHLPYPRMIDIAVPLNLNCGII